VSPGALYEEMGRLDESLMDFNKAIQLTPDDELFLYRRGLVRFKLTNDKGAIEVRLAYISGADTPSFQDFTSSLALDTKQGDVYFWRGFAFERLKKYDLAREGTLT
jgi:tetratricopeptide (TPR) repeat protein